MNTKKTEFSSIYSHGFVRVATATPRLLVAEPDYNCEQTLLLIKQAHDNHAGLIIFPELGLSAYSNDDLFFQDALLDGVEQAIDKLVKASTSLFPLIVVGAPLRVEGRLFNTAIIIHKGRILGAVPKIYLPNYREFYERRQFTPGSHTIGKQARIAGRDVPFGTDLLFCGATDRADFILHTEICEDLWVPVPPSSYGAMAGASVLANLSASNITIGKSDERHALCRAHSRRCLAACLYSAAGLGESTTDLAWDGHAMIYENGKLLAESARFSGKAELTCVDVDLELLRQERMRHGTFGDCADEHKERLGSFRRVAFELGTPQAKKIALLRNTSRFPLCPQTPRSCTRDVLKPTISRCTGCKKGWRVRG